MTGAQGENGQFQEREAKGLQNALSFQGYVCIKESARDRAALFHDHKNCLNLSLLPIMAKH